jgi:hypothetical protein
MAGRGAGRIEDELWAAFLAKCQVERLPNTGAMRRMIRDWTGYPDSGEPAPAAAEPGSPELSPPVRLPTGAGR